MARLESVQLKPHRALIESSGVRWTPLPKKKAEMRLPMIFWNSGAPWREANVWALESATTGEIDIRTVQSRASALLAYANWLESTGTDWWEFPMHRAKRCLVRYRGELIRCRKAGRLAPSTTSHRMQVAIQFYRWLRDSGLLSISWPMWEERVVGIHLKDPLGFERTISVKTTDLSIPNRSIPGTRLEDGLLPIRAVDRDAALQFADRRASEELFLMLTLGFFTGMRIGTIADLKVQTLDNAVPNPAAPGFYQLSVGPATDPPVATKFGVTGQIPICETHLNRLRDYASSMRRLKREAKASRLNKDLVFLTRYGNPYCQRGSHNSNAINVEMAAFRKISVANGIGAMRDFHFHQSRCTFATELARLAIRLGGSLFAVSMVMEALLHKNESTALDYVKFVEKSKIKEEVGNAFDREFLGLLRARQENNNAQTENP
ncbi:site-specific integrase [Paraburkholderia sp. MM5384-R2]|uniref:site-specific integrase n=1 Tax=Paraburkholderia sp. MM5384-R2 TaxID=2723097 RepID=UPI00161762A2|nr:site-specific integrase [Paraburkholderia sp. MM5384-R2]MBB5502342.1 integrase [Paraburkholderia sp. MM5384-R2]